ncbi:MAG: YitT family protein [Bacillota bacterium]
MAIRREIRDYLGILIGVTVTSLGLVWLLIPNKIAAGGVSGLATVFYYLWGWPVALTMLMLNIPLFLACLWEFGPRFGVKTLFGAAFLSIMIQFWDTMVNLIPLTKDPLLASLYGGVITGAGMGVAFRFRGTTGGTDLAAQLLNRFTGISVGYSLLLFDGTVIVLAGLVFHSVELALYAMITLFITSKALDAVLEGLNYAKAAFIISDNPQAISKRILTDLQRGATGLIGRGLYSTQKKEVILSVISRAEEIKLKELVKEIDPRAFIIITDVREVLGEGFKE